VQWIWKQNSGHKGRETAAAYSLFVEFLESGPDRGVHRFAKDRGLVAPNVYDRAKRFNWVERAEAYDEWLAAGRPPEVLPQEEKKPQRKLSPTEEAIKQAKTKKATVPTAPPEIYQQDSALEPEVIGAAMEKAGSDRLTGELLEYRQVMHVVGKAMGLRAVAIDGIVGIMQGNIERTLKGHERAMAAQDYVAASAQMQSVNAMVLSFTKLCDTMSKQAEAARACWGDALGVNQMLKQMYQQMEANRKMEASQD
jgi:hypothetical protein